jgi:hypothetical protein
MTRKILRLVPTLALALAGAPALAWDPAFGLDLSLHGGWDRYDTVTLKSGLSAANFTDSQQMRDNSLSAGATAIVRLGLLEVGAIGELGRPGRDNPTAAVGALAGVGLSFGRLRLEGLGELGGHRYADALANPSVIQDTNRADWLAYVGLRPGISLRLGEGGNALLGLWGYARWDLNRKGIPVTLADLSGSGQYDLGGSQIGVALRLGVTF